MPKYWGKQIFTHGSFQREKERRPKVGNNNGQPRIANATVGGARKPPGPRFKKKYWPMNLKEEAGQYVLLCKKKLFVCLKQTLFIKVNFNGE